MRKQVVFYCLLLFFLSACGGTDSGLLHTDTPEPRAVFTAAAQTAEARRIERFSKTATVVPQSIIETSAFSSPTSTGVPTLSPTPQLSPTSSTPLPTAPPAGSERAEFVADVNIPDGTVFAPNQTFQKTWRILNAGQTTWTTDYALVFIDGALMGAPASLPLPKAVNPGENVEITVDLVAPPDAGSYRGYWKLRNASGQIFGFGAAGSEAIWVDIVVESSQASAAVTVTPGSSGVISALSLSVDTAQVTGVCPHAFVFTARITLSASATLTYALEAGAKSGAQIRLPPPATQNLGAGEHLVVYDLTIPDDTVGWARLHVTAPAQAFSNQVDFSLTCA